MAIGSQMDNMLTVKEVCRILHVHPNTLRRWAEKGTIRSLCINPRGDRRFYFRDIDEYLSGINNGINNQKQP